MKEREFNPHDRPDLLLKPDTYLKYKHGATENIWNLTIAEIVTAMSIETTKFYTTESEL